MNSNTNETTFVKFCKRIQSEHGDAAIVAYVKSGGQDLPAMKLSRTELAAMRGGREGFGCSTIGATNADGSTKCIEDYISEAAGNYWNNLKSLF